MFTRFVMLASASLVFAACSEPEGALAQQSAEPSNIEGSLFVANKFGNTLSKVDLKSGEEVLRRESCTNPHELATSPDGKHVALACYGGTTVDVFSTSDLQRVTSIDLGENARPHGIVWHSAGAIYASAEGRESIFKISDPLSDESQLTEFKTNKRGSHMVAVAPDESAAWTTDLGSKTVTRIDLAGDAEPLSVTVGEEPEGISLTPDGSALWVSARGSNEAYELDPVSMEVRRTVKVGNFPLRLAVHPDREFAITSDLFDGGLSVIDIQLGTKARIIPVSSPEEAEDRVQVTILWSPDGERIYVAETGSDTIAEVDFEKAKVLRRFSVGDGGDGMAILSAQ